MNAEQKLAASIFRISLCQPAHLLSGVGVFPTDKMPKPTISHSSVRKRALGVFRQATNVGNSELLLSNSICTFECPSLTLAP